MDARKRLITKPHLSTSCSGELKTRTVVDRLCSPNISLFRKVKAVEKWLVTGEEGGVKQATCVWLHLPNFICQCTMDFFSRNVTTRVIQHLSS